MVKLQHQCRNCGCFLADEDHFSVETLPYEMKLPSQRRTIEMPHFLCQKCLITADLNPAQTVTFVPHESLIRDDFNSPILSRVFENRQVFLTVCQSYHYQFDQVLAERENEG